ncbi:hypothetical protein F5Y16DRAFT_383780 [Xylariaceae sp. FL0255]|nr:hypothetical protein F5Y16DRAFT_383780 [Xylariaceae sp. FL0255]
MDVDSDPTNTLPDDDSAIKTPAQRWNQQRQNAAIDHIRRDRNWAQEDQLQEAGGVSPFGQAVSNYPNYSIATDVTKAQAPAPGASESGGSSSPPSLPSMRRLLLPNSKSSPGLQPRKNKREALLGPKGVRQAATAFANLSADEENVFFQGLRDQGYWLGPIDSMMPLPPDDDASMTPINAESKAFLREILANWASQGPTITGEDARRYYQRQKDKGSASAVMGPNASASLKPVEIF